MKKLLSILLAICILAMTMTTVVMAEGEEGEETITSINVASAANNATATAGAQKTANPASNAIDVETESITSWIAYNANKYTDMWLQVEFANVSSVNELTFASTTNTTAASYNVFYSLTGKDDSWTELTSITQTAETSTYQFEVTVPSNGIIAKYIKIVRVGTTKTISLHNVVAMGNHISYPYLKSLEVPNGTLLPAFNPEITSYKVQVEDFKNFDFDSIEDLPCEAYLNDASCDQTKDALTNTITIAVTQNEEIKNYTVQYVPYNWALSVNGASATGFETVAKQPESFAIDGDESTYWQSYYGGTSKAGRWLKVTLEEPMAINKIAFNNNTSGDLEKWMIEYSLTGEDGSWVKATDITRPNGKEKPYIQIASFDANPVLAKYVKFTYVTATGNIVIKEVEVYGDKLTNDLTTSSGVSSDNKLIGNIAHLNNAQTSVSDNCYIMAIYVDDVLYSVIPADKSANTISAGEIEATSISSAVLPETGTVTAKLFVWNSLSNLVPVTDEPITLR